MSGVFKFLHAKIFDNSVLNKDATLFQIFLYCTVNAVHEPVERTYRGNTVKLERGQVWVDEYMLANKFGILRGRARRKLLKGERHGFFTRNCPEKAIKGSSQRRSIGTIVTICNYDLYQAPLKSVPKDRSKDRSPQKIINTKRVKSNLVERAPKKIPAATPLSFSGSSGTKKKPAQILAELYSETKTELLPPQDLAKLSPKVAQAAAVAFSLQSDLAIWKSAFVRVGKSRWLTGQEPGKDGRLFDGETVFEFLVSPGKLESVLAGKYDASQRRSIKPPLELDASEQAGLRQLNEFLEQRNREWNGEV